MIPPEVNQQAQAKFNSLTRDLGADDGKWLRIYFNQVLKRQKAKYKERIEVLEYLLNQERIKHVQTCEVSA